MTKFQAVNRIILEMRTAGLSTDQMRYVLFKTKDHLIQQKLIIIKQYLLSLHSTL